jgi:hypothetical protein
MEPTNVTNFPVSGEREPESATNPLDAGGCYGHTVQNRTGDEPYRGKRLLRTRLGSESPTDPSGFGKRCQYQLGRVMLQTPHGSSWIGRMLRPHLGPGIKQWLKQEGESAMSLQSHRNTSLWVEQSCVKTRIDPVKGTLQRIVPLVGAATYFLQKLHASCFGGSHTKSFRHPRGLGVCGRLRQAKWVLGLRTPRAVLHELPKEIAHRMMRTREAEHVTSPQWLAGIVGNNKCYELSEAGG